MFTELAFAAENCVVCSELVFAAKTVLFAANQFSLPNYIETVSLPNWGVSTESVFAAELFCPQRISVCCRIAVSQFLLPNLDGTSDLVADDSAFSKFVVYEFESPVNRFLLTSSAVVLHI